MVGEKRRRGFEPKLERKRAREPTKRLGSEHSAAASAGAAGFHFRCGGRGALRSRETEPEVSTRLGVENTLKKDQDARGRWAAGGT